jgi:hypothetical protein
MRLLAGLAVMVAGIASMFIGRNAWTVGAVIVLSAVWFVLTMMIANRVIDGKDAR